MLRVGCIPKPQPPGAEELKAMLADSYRTLALYINTNLLTYLQNYLQNLRIIGRTYHYVEHSPTASSLQMYLSESSTAEHDRI